MNLVIGYFYPHALNLYGDDGNVQILKSRASQRGINVEVHEITFETSSKDIPNNINLIFMGGGPDSSQKNVYKDLHVNKKTFLKDYIESEGVGLYICGAYQLLGNYYKSSDSEVLKGLEIFDIHTEHFGNHKPRCIGNVICEITGELMENPAMESNNSIGSTIVGFENHGGRTYLGKGVSPFTKVIMGHGNNSEDNTEGIIYKNSIGSYLHGPILARNPHLADYLIASALKVTSLKKLDDVLINSAHDVSLELKQ